MADKSEDTNLALFGTRALNFSVPESELCWLPEHVNYLLASANALQQILHDRLEQEDCELESQILSAHVGIGFIVAMAGQLSAISRREKSA